MILRDAFMHTHYALHVTIVFMLVKEAVVNKFNDIYFYL